MGKRRQATMPLIPMVIEGPFQQWGLDFISFINLNSSACHNFILTATNYFIRWSEAMSYKSVDQELVIKMIRRLITHFGIPQAIMSDNS